MNKRIIIILVGIVFLALVMRVWQIGNVPPSPDWDEVALGYNAYSIANTGHDEFGKFLPVVLRSFDDYKPALYAYLIIPFLYIFGLTIIAVRLPSVVFGLLTIIATFFLVVELISRKNISIAGRTVSSEYVGLLAAFLLAISPWHIQFSRIAFESNIGLSFNIFAFLFFLKALKKPHYLFLSFLCGVAALYVYQSEKVFTPLLFVMLIVVFWKDFFHIDKKIIFSSIGLAVLLTLPMIVFILTNKNALLRAQGVSIFADQTHFLERNTKKLDLDTRQHDLVGLLLDNRRIEYAKAVVSGYISHFDFNWLFISGDLTRHHAPFMGMMYLIEFPFLLIGIYLFIFTEFARKKKIALILYFLLVPIPASITNGVPHAVRTLNFLPTFQIFTAFGLVGTYIFVSRFPIFKYIFFGLFTIAALANFSYYLNQYFVQQNYYYAFDWQYGYQDAISYLKPILKEYPHVIVDNRSPMDQSYMFFLFYLKYPPQEYLNQGGTYSGGYNEKHIGIGNMEFRPVDWSHEESGNLIVARPSDIPQNATILKKVYYPNGDEAIVIAKR